MPHSRPTPGRLLCAGRCKDGPAHGTLRDAVRPSATGMGKESVIRRIRRAMLIGCACMATLMAGLWVASHWRGVIVVIPLPSGDRDLVMVTQVQGRVITWIDWNASPYYLEKMVRESRLHSGTQLVQLTSERHRLGILRGMRERPEAFMSSPIPSFVGSPVAPWPYLTADRFSVPPHVSLSQTPGAVLPFGNWTGWEITLPHGLLLAVFATWPMIASWRWLRGRKRFEKGCCPACGYDLRGSEGRLNCPECGGSVEPVSSIKKAAA